jgi:hypothetical protein
MNDASKRRRRRREKMREKPEAFVGNEPHV